MSHSPHQSEAAMSQKDLIMSTNVETSASEITATTSCMDETCSAVERIARFTANAQPEHLGREARELYKRNILIEVRRLPLR
jgi:hypothetical protein